MHQVLVVEDEPGIRRVLRVLLEAERYRVVEAETAARADSEARTHKPDLLIVDLGLPDGDGLDVIRRVRAWSPVPIVVLSARTLEDQKVAALDAGAIGARPGRFTRDFDADRQYGSWSTR